MLNFGLFIMINKFPVGLDGLSEFAILNQLKCSVIVSPYVMKFNKAAVEYVADQGYDPLYGARPLNRSIQRHIEDPVADAVLSGTFSEGDTIKITYDKKQGKIVLS